MCICMCVFLCLFCLFVKWDGGDIDTKVLSHVSRVLGHCALSIFGLSHAAWHFQCRFSAGTPEVAGTPFPMVPMPSNEEACHLCCFGHWGS